MKVCFSELGKVKIDHNIHSLNINSSCEEVLKSRKKKKTEKFKRRYRKQFHHMTNLRAVWAQFPKIRKQTEEPVCVCTYIYINILKKPDRLQFLVVFLQYKHMRFYHLPVQTRFLQRPFLKSWNTRLRCSLRVNKRCEFRQDVHKHGNLYST